MEGGAVEGRERGEGLDGSLGGWSRSVCCSLPPAQIDLSMSLEHLYLAQMQSTASWPVIWSSVHA